MHTVKSASERRESGVEGGDSFFEHPAVCGRSRPAEVVLGTCPRQHQQPTSFELESLLGGERRALDRSPPRGLLLLRFHLLGFKTASHTPILRGRGPY